VLRRRHKLLIKRHLAEPGVPMTAFLEAAPDQPPRTMRDVLGEKIVVKDRTSSGGRGIVVAEDVPTLEAARGRGRIAERFVDAPEISVESFVNRGEILFRNVTEYVRKGHVNLVTAILDDATRDAVMALNRHVIESLRIEWGITHLEMYLTGEGPLFGEIALRPPGGYIMELIEIAWGFSAWDAFLAVELDAPIAFPGEASRTAVASVLHPGTGRVTRLAGADALRADPRVVSWKLGVGVGDVVGPRIGVGNEVGHVLLAGRDREEALAALGFVDATLQIEVAPGEAP
jgi:biotin carboxylase